MPIFQNILRKAENEFQGLKNFDVLVDVKNDNNQYFNVSDFPDELTLGNSSFLIEGSDLLKNDIDLKIEILDSDNKVIFTSPVDNYLEGKARRVSVEAYKETSPGPATLTILGELNPSKVNVPGGFRNTYNVRYTKDFFINTTKLNNRPILFYGQPTVSATEKLIGQNDTIQSTEQLTETVTGKVSIKVDTTTSEDTGGGLVIP
jgi:hypothetical protein|tara:strand:- start:448 stop:1059 length:612 start_codon:yes stop_codon:yes gene_type:complete